MDRESKEQGEQWTGRVKNRESNDRESNDRERNAGVCIVHNAEIIEINVFFKDDI